MLRLQQFWRRQGCALTQPLDIEVGAGTFHPDTFLRAIGPEPWRAAYAQPSRRPQDGRYGDNPNRLQRYYQFQVVIKPSPPDFQQLYLQSLSALGVSAADNDIRFVEDDWESPTLGAWGLGWEVWLNGMEVSQFTYFQEVGGLSAKPVTGEITYGLERLAMFLQGRDDVSKIRWKDSDGADGGGALTYGHMHSQGEYENSCYNFSRADVALLSRHFDDYESMARTLLNKEDALPIPAYEMTMKCSHLFNLLDARGAISVTERTRYVARVRNLSRAVAAAYLQKREEAGFPLMQVDFAESEKAR